MVETVEFRLEATTPKRKRKMWSLFSAKHRNDKTKRAWSLIKFDGHNGYVEKNPLWIIVFSCVIQKTPAHEEWFATMLCVLGPVGDKILKWVNKGENI